MIDNKYFEAGQMSSAYCDPCLLWDYSGPIAEAEAKRDYAPPYHEKPGVWADTAWEAGQRHKRETE